MIVREILKEQDQDRQTDIETQIKKYDFLLFLNGEQCIGILPCFVLMHPALPPSPETMECKIYAQREQTNKIQPQVPDKGVKIDNWFSLKTPI